MLSRPSPLGQVKRIRGGLDAPRLWDTIHGRGQCGTARKALRGWTGLLRSQASPSSTLCESFQRQTRVGGTGEAGDGPAPRAQRSRPFLDRQGHVLDQI